MIRKLLYPRSMLMDPQEAWIARFGWAVIAGSMIVLFFMGVPNAYAILNSVFPETARALGRIGLSARIYAQFVIGLDVFTFSFMSAIALLIMLRKSNDRVAVLVSLLLISTGMIYTVPAYESGAPIWLLAILISIGEIVQVMFFFVFPDGRFIPKWSWVIALVMAIWRPLVWAFSYIPLYFDIPRLGETYGGLRQDFLQIMLMLSLFVFGIASQIYRFRRMSDNMQRQQTKWLLFGVMLAFGLAVPYLLGVNVFGLASRPGETPLLIRTLGRLVRQIGFCLVPVTLLFSMFRYRLWEVDRLINRALIYSSLTLALTLIYVASVFVMQQLFRRLTSASSDLLVIVISTIGIASLFEPLRQFLRRAIDKRFFRTKYDADQTAIALTSVLQNEVDLENIKMRVAGAVENALQPEHMSIWVRERSIPAIPSSPASPTTQASPARPA